MDGADHYERMPNDIESSEDDAYSPSSPKYKDQDTAPFSESEEEEEEEPGPDVLNAQRRQREDAAKVAWMESQAKPRRGQPDEESSDDESAPEDDVKMYDRKRNRPTAGVSKVPKDPRSRPWTPDPTPPEPPRLTHQIKQKRGFVKPKSNRKYSQKPKPVQNNKYAVQADPRLIRDPPTYSPHQIREELNDKKVCLRQELDGIESQLGTMHDYMHEALKKLPQYGFRSNMSSQSPAEEHRLRGSVMRISGLCGPIMDMMNTIFQKFHSFEMNRQGFKN